MNHYGEELKQKLIKLGLVGHLSFEGCSEAEIQEIMEAQRVDYLPQIYLEFLEVMGKKRGNFSFGIDTYPSIKFIKSNADAIMDTFSNEFLQTAKLPEDAFVFIDSDGFAFYYFRTKDKDPNPAVLSFLDATEIAWPYYTSLTEFFERSIKELMTIRNRKYPR